MMMCSYEHVFNTKHTVYIKVHNACNDFTQCAPCVLECTLCTLCTFCTYMHIGVIQKRKYTILLILLMIVLSCTLRENETLVTLSAPGLYPYTFENAPACIDCRSVHLVHSMHLVHPIHPVSFRAILVFIVHQSPLYSHLFLKIQQSAHCTGCSSVHFVPLVQHVHY